MDSTNRNIHHDAPMSNNFNIHDNSLLLSDPLVPSDYNLPTLKDNCEILRTGNDAEYLQKNEFMPEISSDMGLNVDFDHENHYRADRQLNAPSSSYEMKSLNHELPNMSFADELRSLNRDPNAVSSFNYYSKNISPGPDVYSQEFSTDFTNSNFSSSLPSTSSIFPSADNPSCYVISETQPDEMILNGIELNEPEKLIGLLSNEELDAARHGSCFEVILNNGEILYAVIDSESEFGSSVRLVQIAKEMLVSERQCSLPVSMNSEMSDHLNEPQFESTINVPQSSFSSKSTVENFDVAARNYHPDIPTSLSKSINSTPIAGENFSLCCDFQTNNSRSHFPSDMDNYSTIVSSKAAVSFNESALSKSDIIYTCASDGSPTKGTSVSEAEPKITKSTTVSQTEPKIDYFPSAVHSIVVSETGKKYPKKYSFYSNNFSSFEKSGRKSDLNSSKLCQLPCTSTAGATSVDNLNEINERLRANDEVVIESENLKSQKHDDTTSKMDLHSTVQLTNVPELNSNVADIPLIRDSQNFCQIDLVDDDNDCATNHYNFIPNHLNEEQISKDKFLNSRLTGAVNSICDQAVQSRARATLPTTYLSINRIKSTSANNKSTYGIFARQTIPGRTQFGPMEGVLIKTENKEKTREEDSSKLQLTVAVDDKFWQLDVSNEDVSNWMRFVRPATSYKEQNLMLTQQESSLYFTTIEVIHPKQELLVWYGAAYSRLRNYKLLPGDPCDDMAHNNLIDPVTHLSTVLNSDDDIVRETFSNNERKEILTENEIVANERKSDENRDRNTVNETVSRSDDLRSMNKSTADTQCFKRRTTKKGDKANKSSLWLCEYCDMTFSNGDVMNLHMLAHSKDEPSTEMSATSELMKDDEAELNSQKYICPQCNQSFSMQKELVSHVAKHGLKVQRWNDSKPTESVIDKESESEKDNFEDTTAAKEFQCQFCKKVLKNSVALSVHERIHSENTFLECPICDATFEKLTAMKEHVHTHAKNGIFSCPHCPKTYDRYKVIRKHIRSVHVIAKYVCKQCKKCFRSQYKLRSHMLKHSDNREFLCANCGKQFKRIDKLTEHIRNIHSEEREKKNMELMSNASSNKSHKRILKKKMPNKVLRLISENVNDYFYKCYVCNIGFKRRGMLVNHINMFHPNISLDTIPELNVPILKAYCNFFCQYCDRVYKSNSKRKAHIIKSHPGAKIPSNSERGAVLNDPYAKHVKNVILDPFNCDYCYRQYASRAKLLSHHRRDHADLIPSEMKLPRIWQKKKRKLETAKVDNSNTICSENREHNRVSNTENNVQLRNVQLEIGNCSNTNVNTNTQQVVLQNNTKNNTNDVSQVTNLQQLLTDELRNSISPEQYLKILQSFNGIAIAQADENSSTVIQQILTSYSFSGS